MRDARACVCVGGSCVGVRAELGGPVTVFLFIMVYRLIYLVS